MANKKKNFIITIDNEEDNQWNTSEECTTKNAEFLPRFQMLCERYGFKPVYLTTYNMAKNPFFVEFASDAMKRGTCEVGMHLHAWCTPPNYQLTQVTNNRSYLNEYPLTIMEEKVKQLDNVLSDTFGYKAVSHRSGRWALNEDYVDILCRNGYKCDCSVTPGVNWSGSLGVTGLPGSDYRKNPNEPYMIGKTLLEVPVTIQNLHYFDLKSIDSPRALVREMYHLIKGKQSWIRPSITSLYQMKQMFKKMERNNDYAMFMIHSSELMPGGSPYFKNEYDVECLYETLEELFDYVSADYKGITLETYANQKMNIC